MLMVTIQRAVVHAAKVATEYRQKFRKDVVLDMNCLQKFGHKRVMNLFTQPSCIKKLNSSELLQFTENH